MRETENRLSSIDVFAPGGRFVIASDGEGRISNEAQERLPLLPIPWVTSNEIDWDRSLLRPGYNRYAPRFGLAWRPRGQDKTVLRVGYGIFLNQWAYSVQTALTRNLPFFELKRIDVPSDVLVPTLKTASILTSDATGTIGGSVMDYNYRTEYTQTWSAGIQHQIAHDTVIEAFYMGSRTTGADNSTIRNVPEPDPGPIDMRRPVTALGAVRAALGNCASRLANTVQAQIGVRRRIRLANLEATDHPTLAGLRFADTTRTPLKSPGWRPL